MVDGSSPFAVALSRHQRSVLQAAFDRCNRRPDLTPYDRTALGRWLAGDTASREAFVTALAAEVGDPAILEAWHASRGDAVESNVKRVVSSFMRLPAVEQREALRQINQHMATDGPPIRQNFSIEVELEDWPGRDDQFRIQVSLRWHGELPARARVLLLTDVDALPVAYSQPDCLFRDVLAIDQATLVGSLAGLPQSLRFASQDEPDARSTRSSAVVLEPGVIQFDNPAVARARIHLDLAYPYPADVSLFPILFSGYQVRGPVEVRLVLRTARAQHPRCYPFLGTEQNWSESPYLNRLQVEAGREGQILSFDTGLVLAWSVLPARPVERGRAERAVADGAG